MNAACDKLLAGAALAFDQHCARHRRDLLDLHQHFAQRFRIAAQSRFLTEPTTLKQSTHDRRDIVGLHRLHQHVGVPQCTQSFAHAWLIDIGETNNGNAGPQLFAHDLHVAGVEERAGDHHNVRLKSLE